MIPSRSNPHSSRRRRLWPWLVFGPPVFALAVITVLILVLRTDFGLTRLERLLNQNLKNVAGQTITLAGLHGRFPFDLRLRELRLADSDGLWLTLDDLVLRWSGRDLLVARLRAFELSVATLELSRLPATQAAEPKPKEPFRGFDPPRAFPRIAVDRLAVEKIILAEPVAGERTVLDLEAALDAGVHGLLADLRLETLEGTVGLLAVRANFSPDTDRLQLNAAFTDPGGRLSSLLGLPENTPLQLQLVGDGPPSMWSGSLTAQAGDLAALHSTLRLAWQDAPGLRWDGELTADANMVPAPADAYLTRTKFTVLASLPTPESIVLDEFTLGNPLFQARLEASMDLSVFEINGSLALDVLDTGPLQRLVGMDMGPEIRLAGVFNGPLTGPDLHLALDMRDLASDQAMLAALNLDTTVVFQQDNQNQTIMVQGDLTVHGLNLPGVDIPQALADKIVLHYDFGFEQQNLLVLNALSLQGQDLNLLADAHYALDNAKLSAHLELLPFPLDPWLDRFEQNAQARAGFKVAAHGTLQPMNLSLDIQAGLTDITGLPRPLPDLLGDSLHLTTTLELLTEKTTPKAAGPGVIQTLDLHLTAQSLDLRADARFTPQDGQIQAAARLDLPDLRRASPFVSLDLGGAARLEAVISGSLGHGLDLDATLTSQDLGLVGLAPFPLRVSLLGRDLLNKPNGNLAVDTSPLDTPLAARLDFTLTENLLRWSGLELTLPQGIVSGQGLVHLDSGLARAQLQGDIEDIAPLLRLAQLDGQDMHAALRFQAEVRPENDALNADLRVHLEKFQANFGRFNSLALQARADNLLTEPLFDAKLTLDSLLAGENRVDGLTARLSGTLEELEVRATATGHALHAFDLGVQANLTTKSTGHEMRLERLDGIFADQSLVLALPVLFTLDGENITLSPLTLHFGQAVVRARAEILDGAADLRFGLEGLPLEIFTKQVQGEITAGVVLSGPKTGLTGNLTLLGHNLAPRNVQLNITPAVDIHAEIVLTDEGLALEAVATRAKESSSLMRAVGRVPLRLALEPAGIDLPKTAPIRSTISGSLDLTWLGNMALPETQFLSGLVEMELQLAGTVGEPLPSGRVIIRDAAYQHLVQGVLLQDIFAEVLLEHNALLLRSLSATDGAQGVLKASGRTDLSQEQGFPFAFSIQARTLNVLNSPLARARLADLELEILGTAAAQEIQGHVDMDRVEIFLKDLGGPPVAELPVVELNAEHPAAPQPKQQDGFALPLSLDVDVRFPARVFVRGRGLDSEWGGALNIVGNASAPDVRGDITVQRGRLDLLGKRFILSEQSVVRFSGSQPPAPFVNIKADQTGPDHVFTLNVTGVVPDIDLQLTSQPPLPEDEVLSRMLFGRSLDSITPVQAARLAMAARELAGHGGGMDILGSARDILHLDDLDIASGSQSGNMSLRAGKYVNERVYLRLDSDLKTGEEEMSADVELTPRMTLESTIGPKGGGLGLFWKYDY